MSSLGFGYLGSTSRIESRSVWSVFVFRAAVVNRGYTIGMDHLTWRTQSAGEANAKTLSWQERARSIKTLTEAGYCNKLFLSNDWCFGILIAGSGTKFGPLQSATFLWLVIAQCDMFQSR
jgi:hypothetical protein